MIGLSVLALISCYSDLHLLTPVYLCYLNEYFVHKASVIYNIHADISLFYAIIHYSATLYASFCHISLVKLVFIDGVALDAITLLNND